MLLSTNVDSLHWAQLVPGSATTLGRVNHLDTETSGNVNQAWLSLHG